MAGLNDEEKDIVIIGGGIALLYFGVLRPILRNLGIDSADKETVDAVNTIDPSQNPFSYLFQPAVDYYTPLYDSQAGGSAQTYWQGYRNALLAAYGYNFPPIGTTNFDEGILAEQLYSTISFWKEPDVDLIKSIFNLLPTQFAVAGIDAYLQFNYNTDLLTFLKGGKRYLLLLQWGLTDTDLASIINHVQSLPVQ